MKKDNTLYLIHISECIGRIEQYMSELQVDFFRDFKTQDAVVRNLQILAESSQRLSNDFKTEHSEIDWKGLSGFRNVLVHDYLGVDIKRVLEIIRKDLPPLKTTIELILKEQSGDLFFKPKQ